MQGLSGPQDAGAWRFRRLVVTAALIVALFAVLLLSPLPGQGKLLISGLGLVAGGLAMAASFRYRHRQSVGRRRHAWTLFMIAALLAACSNLILLVSALRWPDPNRTISDLILLLGLLIGVAGLARFPLARRRLTDISRMALDGFVLGGSILFLANVTVFPQILDPSDRSGAVLLIVPIVDVVIATIATLLFLRGAPKDRPPLGLAAIGFACYALSDIAYAVQVSQNGAHTLGSITDLGWILGYALIALAVRSPGSEASPHGERPVEPSSVLGTVVVFGLFLVGVVISVIRLNAETLTAGSAVLWFVVLLAVLGRQIVLTVDNDRLRQILERRVSERNRSLRQVTQQSDLLVNSVGDGIYGVDREGLVTFVNPAAAHTLGYRPDKLIGRNAHVTFHESQDDGSPFPADRCYVTEAIRDQVATNSEEDTYRRADGRAIPVELTATPLIEDDRAIGAVVVFRDVTQRREVDRLKGEFVSMVSHELRTPLTAIRGSLGLIAGGAMGELTPSAARMVQIALVSSERLTRLINEILDIERIESGVLPMELGAHSVRGLLDAAVGQVQVIAEDSGVRVRVAGAEGEVYADPDRVVQTLLNLLGNALKFSPPGTEVTLHAATRGTFVEFSIRDQGRGIPADKLDQVFARFEQVDSSDAREKGGSGLGLAISRSIVERLGGRIWAENNPSGGATFRFTLPVAADPPAEPKTPAIMNDPEPGPRPEHVAAVSAVQTET